MCFTCFVCVIVVYFRARFFGLVDLLDDFFVVVDARLDAFRLDLLDFLTAAMNASHLALTDGDIGMTGVL